MADKKENLIEEEVKETKKATRKKKSDEDSAKSTAKKPRKGKEGACLLYTSDAADEQ